MNKLFAILAFAGGVVFGSGLAYTVLDPADVNRDGTVNVLDVQFVINEFLGGVTMISPLVITDPFIDVDSDRNTFEAIDGLRKEGQIAGRSSSPPMFYPDSVISRAEIAVLIARAKHGVDPQMPVSVDSIPDVPFDFWGAPWIEYAVDSELMDLLSGNFFPDMGVTRADVASLMWLLMEE